MGSEFHVLLVEDDDGDAFLVEEILSGADEAFAMTRVRSVAEAVVRADDVDCALVDLGLPDAVGLEALTRLRTAAPQLAIVVLTGLVDRARGIEAVGAGAQDYLVKSDIDGASLSKALRYAVERRRAERAEQQLVIAEGREAENRRLSRGLLPLLRVEHPDLNLMTRYRPGASAVLGGDFFDAVMLDDGTVRVVIGDVCGHGPAEAAVGVALRISWRASVVGGATPEQTLAVMDAMLRLERDDESLFATVCDVTVDPIGRQLLVRRHGHPPPLVLGERIEWHEPGAPATPLGLSRRRDADVEALELRSGDAVLLLTDGIYEGRAAGSRLGMDGFVELVVQLRAEGHRGVDLLEQLLARTADRHGGELEDDVALLLLSTAW